LKKVAFWLIIATIVSKITGFGKDIILSYYYGASNISDVYLISLTIPVGIFAFVGAAISTGYIPMYSKIENEHGTYEANKYTNNLLNVIMLICTFIIFAGFLFTEPIVKAFASGFEGSTLNQAIIFTRISLFNIYVMAMIYVFNGFLQLRGRYLIPVLILLPLNIFTIISIILSSSFNILFLPFGTLFATVSQVLFLIPALKRSDFKYEWEFKISDEYIKKMAWIAMPVIIGASVNQINVLVDRTIASNLVIGGISALTYANKLNQFIQGIFVISIATVLYPNISRLATENKIIEYKKSISEALLSVSILIIPTTIGAMIFSEEIVMLLFGRGAFDNQAVMLTATSLFFYSIGMVAFGYREILSRSYYALQDTTTPMKNAILGMILNIVLNIVLSRYLGIGGLALATSIAATFTTILLFISLRKKIGLFGMKQISISFLKILFASLVMGGLAKLSFNYLTASLSQNLSLILAIGVGAVSYFVIIYFMKIEDVDVIVGAIKKKLGRGAA